MSSKCVARLWALLWLVVGTWTSTHAQNVSDAPVVAPGFVIVSGFSGSVQSVPALPPGGGPAERTTIDLGGPVLRVIDANSLDATSLGATSLDAISPGGPPPQGHGVPAYQPLTIRAAQIGQVYGLALDDETPPNIYAAATSAYGLPIVVPTDGAPERVRRGAPNAAFMRGLFAPYPGAGPGSIWKISGKNGAISLFTNVTLDGIGNSGPALGGLAFDPASRRIYVADRGTGAIHSFDLQGVDTGRFDHGTQTLPMVGLPAVPYDPRRRLDIRSSAFDSGDPATWGYAPPARRVFGLAVHRGRLYYAVAAGPAVWSVSLEPDGRFGIDPRIEIAFQVGPVPVAEISKILFDDAGDMLLAERGMPTGSSDFGALVRPDSGPVIRLKAQRPGSDGTPFFWRAVGEYAVGFAPDHRSGDGGMALGFGYSQGGVADPRECGGTLWVTGSRLQGSPVRELRSQSPPPRSSRFIDFSDATGRAGALARTPGQLPGQSPGQSPGLPVGQKLGHLGDVAVWRTCPGPLLSQLVELLSEDLFCPAGFYDSRNQCMPAPCAPGELYRGGVCEKPECRPGERVRDASCCPAGSNWNPRARTCSSKPADRPDLAIRTEVAQCEPHAGPCTFRIVMSNDSDVPYSGPIFVGDTIHPGTIQSMTGPPGWTCGPVSGAISACIDLDARLESRQSVEFKVIAAVPGSAQRWSGCAGITSAAGRGPSGGNNKSCVTRGNDIPAEPGTPDLAVRTSLKSCSANRCDFVIVIRNVGTAAYNGDLRLGEMIGGGTITSIVPFETGWSLPCQQGPAPSGGTGLACYRPGTTLAPGDTLTMGVTVTHPPGTRLVGHCAIVDPPPGDSNPANNGSCAEHRPEDARPRLVMEKSLTAPCERVPGTGFGYAGWSCEFATTVTNTSAVRFSGDIKVTDTVTPGRIVSVSGEATDCSIDGTSLLCQWSGKTLAPGGATRIAVRVHLPANVTYETCARLDAPASGDQACVGGLPADQPPPREASQPDPVCAGGSFLMRPVAAGAQCCSLRSIVAGTCGGSRTGCADGTSFNLRSGSCEKRTEAACADDARLGDRTCCPEGQNVGAEGRCEPLLLCRGDMIVRGGECVCPGARRDVDGECTGEPVRIAEECPADRAAAVAANTCVCRSGREEGGVCLPPALVEPQRRAQAAECREDQVRVANRCLSPDLACSGGKIRLMPGAACACPRGTAESGSRCETVQLLGGRCAGGARNSFTGQCMCPRGTALVDGDCVASQSGPGFMPVICPGETRVVGGFCACAGDMQVQSDNACACPAGFGIRPGGSTPIGRKERGLCERCPPGQGLTPDGYCAPSCPQEIGWICLAPGREADPVAQASNCACMPLALPEQTSARVPACPRGQIRHFERCCTPEAVADGTCGGTSPLATVCPAPLFAFAGQCCTRDAIGTARCSTPALGAPEFSCGRGQIRGDDGGCYDVPRSGQRSARLCHDGRKPKHGRCRAVQAGSGKIRCLGRIDARGKCVSKSTVTKRRRAY